MNSLYDGQNLYYPDYSELRPEGARLKCDGW